MQSNAAIRSTAVSKLYIVTFKIDATELAKKYLLSVVYCLSLCHL